MEIHRSEVFLPEELFQSSIWEILFPQIYIDTETYTENGVEIAEGTEFGWLQFRYCSGEIEMICRDEILLTQKFDDLLLVEKDGFFLEVNLLNKLLLKK
jgi:hypothetical protein